MIKELVGWQIVSMNDEGFVVSKEGKKRTFKFYEDGGDCCGYNVLEANLFYEERSNSNPVITSVKFKDESGMEKDHIVITFFGGYKPLAIINSLSSSESGYEYGACVSCECVETGEVEIISCW